MRISDWSSDVCSSDLARTAKRFETRVGLDDHPAGRPGLDDRLLLAYLAGRAVGAAERHAALQIGVDQPGGRERSEERRVGKECVSTCRSRWSPEHEKKKKDRAYKH